MKALIQASKAEDCPYEIVLVASNRPEAEGLEIARTEGIATWAQSHKGMERAAFDRLIGIQLVAHRVETVALAGYMRLLSPEFIAAWKGRILNIHPSLLPRHKGVDTHRRALEAGDRVHGCSVHMVTAELDDGPVIARSEIAIQAGDTPESLAERVLAAEHELYPKALSEWLRQ
jgi:formyltetrahydrofolate-dependent phosphoribosylglycinamide formyltransferase